MVALQILCKCLAEGNVNLIEHNQLTEEYFHGYEEERNFIVDHFKQYGNTPDRATFLSKFPDIELVEVTESDKYLVDTIREEHLYYQAVPIVQKIAELLKSDANSATEYMMQAIKNLQPNYSFTGVDIIADALTRYEEFLQRKDKQEEWFFTTGFPELDDAIHGIQRKEEFLVIFARTNQGKSWVLEKIMTHIWEIGFNVGYVSPEMSASSVGYRFDTLYKNFSNKGLVWGNKEIADDEYRTYIDDLRNKNNKFMVATPNDFGRNITVSKLRNWIKQYDLHAIAIDGITYLSDERSVRGDNKTTSLTNISEDLMGLSIELGVPILAVVQANRGGVVEADTDDLPELESIRDSDGISHNATKVLSIRQNKSGNLLMQVKKQRNGVVGTKIAYQWNPNIGEFLNISGQSINSAGNRTQKKRPVEKEDVF